MYNRKKELEAFVEKCFAEAREHLGFATKEAYEAALKNDPTLFKRLHETVIALSA